MWWFGVGRRIGRIAFAVAFSLVVGVAGGVATGVASHDSTARAAEQSGISEGEARSAVDAWLSAVQSGNPDAVRDVLAPEFQIARSNGVSHTAEEYAENLPIITEMPQVENITATRNGDSMVVRYDLTIDETIDGQKMEAVAPRLTVFRKQGDIWMVVAHANFARIEE